MSDLLEKGGVISDVRVLKLTDQICLYCQNWIPWETLRQFEYIQSEITYRDWIIGITQSSCHVHCQILLQAIKKLAPEFLTIEPSIVDDVELFVQKNGRFTIDVWPRDSHVSGVDIQIYSAENGTFCLMFPRS